MLRAESNCSSVVLRKRGLHRECVHCGAECPSDCPGSACGCSRQYGDDKTSSSKLQSLSVEENPAECAWACRRAECPRNHTNARNVCRARDCLLLLVRHIRFPPSKERAVNAGAMTRAIHMMSHQGKMVTERPGYALAFKKQGPTCHLQTTKVQHVSENCPKMSREKIKSSRTRFG